MSHRICCLCEHVIGNGQPYLTARAALGNLVLRHVECSEADTVRTATIEEAVRFVAQEMDAPNYASALRIHLREWSAQQRVNR